MLGVSHAEPMLRMEVLPLSPHPITAPPAPCSWCHSWQWLPWDEQAVWSREALKRAMLPAGRGGGWIRGGGNNEWGPPLISRLCQEGLPGDPMGFVLAGGGWVSWCCVALDFRETGGPGMKCLVWGWDMTLSCLEEG